MNKRYDYLRYLYDLFNKECFDNDLNEDSLMKYCQKRIGDEKKVKEYFDMAQKFLEWAKKTKSLSEEAYAKNVEAVLKCPSKVTPQEIYCVLRYFQLKDMIPKDLTDYFEFPIALFGKGGYSFNASYLKWLYSLNQVIDAGDHFNRSNIGKTKDFADRLFDEFQDDEVQEKPSISELLQIGPILKKDANSVINDLKKHFSKCSSWEDQVLSFYLEDKNAQDWREIKPIQCYFFYFFALQLNGDALKDEEDDRCGQRRLGFFDDLCKNAGYENGFGLFPTMQSIISYNVIRKGEGADNLHRKLALKLRKKRLNIKKVTGQSINYEEWKKSIIDPGLADSEEEAKEMTYMTISAIKEWQGKDMDITREMVNAINDTEVRRHWYFCRIIQKIIERQETLRKNNAMPNDVNEEYLNWVRVGEDGECIVPRRIALTINYAFDGTQCNMALARVALRKFHWDPVNEEDKDGGGRAHEQEIAQLVRFDAYGNNQHPRRITKPLLLLMVLLAKVYGVEGLDMDYVKEHILENSRFDPELNENNRVESYFIDVFSKLESYPEYTIKERMRLLKKETGEMEKGYLKNGTAILQSIFLCKDKFEY